MVARPMRPTPDDLHGNLFGRIPSPGTRPRDVYPRRRPRAACASCHHYSVERLSDAQRTL
ncbi:hypothetical protein E0H62_14365 [Rhizobium leguminosarum bv. viciae]|nr:hypothetical protein E0H62_14365 [Rhizobium leguminosarum bv. viciae]